MLPSSQRVAGAAAFATMLVVAPPARGQNAELPSDAEVLAQALRDAEREARFSEEVTISAKEEKTAAQRLVESAQAVTVIDTKRAREQSADLGEVMARSQ